MHYLIHLLIKFKFGPEMVNCSFCLQIFVSGTLMQGTTHATVMIFLPENDFFYSIHPELVPPIDLSLHVLVAKRVVLNSFLSLMNAIFISFTITKTGRQSASSLDTRVLWEVWRHLPMVIFWYPVVLTARKLNCWCHFVWLLDTGVLMSTKLCLLAALFC